MRCGPRCLRAAAHRRRQIALLPTAGADPRRVDGCRLAADRADEGPGGRAAGQWHAGDVSEFLAGPARSRRPVCAACINGEYRLLYVAPERLMLTDFSKRCDWNVNSSPWTRRIASANGATISARNTARSAELRKLFPEVPLMALTATATERVREDIVKAAQTARPTMLRRQFQSPQSHLPGGSQDPGLRPSAGIRPQPSAGKRHRLLPGRKSTESVAES